MRSPLLLALALALCACDGSSGETDAAVPDASPAEEDAGERPFVEDPRWHRNVVFYELWVRSFQDSDGDGVGDLPGLTSRLDYLADLGVGDLWLMPIFPSPLADSGYDVADYVDVRPDYGTLADFDTLLTEAHARGIHVYVDLVFNHTSRTHPWFQASRGDPAGERGGWFVWADEAGPRCDGAAGPFGEVRWTRDDVRGQFYFHQFYPEQPDLNFDEPAVRDALLDVARFWLDRGTDGFRLDVPYRYDEDLPDCVHRPGTFEFLRRLRAVTDAYDDRSMVGETLAGPEQLAAYLEPDVLQTGFLLAEATLFWVAGSSGNVQGVQRSFDRLVEVTPEGGAFAPVLGNHDLPRISASVDDDPGAMRVLAATLLTLPGVPFVYYGEELGMLSGTETLVDGRDSARTPMQWDDGPNAGFTTGTPFLALAPEHETRNVGAELADEGSLLRHYQRLIRLRNETPALRTGTYRSLRAPNVRTYLFWRRHPDGDRLVVAHFGKEGASDLTVELPEAWAGATLTDEISGEAVGAVEGRTFTASIPPQTA